MELSSEERIRAIKQRIAAYEKKRSELSAMLQMQRAQYNKLVAQAAEAGVQNVNDLPATIKRDSSELNATLTEIEATLNNAEGIVNGL